MKQFWEKHKVFIVGLLSAILLAANELLSAGEASDKVLLFAVFIAALSYLSKNLRGQWATIMGVVATSVATILEQSTSGHITWRQILIQAGIAILAALSSPPKDREYEHSPTITQAKTEAIEIKATKEEMVPPKVTTDSTKPPVS